MEDFVFYTPTKVICGRGSADSVADEAKMLGKKGLVVTDKGMLATGLVSRVTDSLDRESLDYEIWSDIVPNPRDTDIEKGAKYALDHEIDYMIAIGGGSSMDTAKAMGALMANGGTCADWYEGNLKKPIAPLICIPTTCGTGSEVTHEAVVNNTKTMEKNSIWGPMVNVTVAILDSSLMDKLPAAILSATGMDALTHAIEAYVCKVSNPLTDAIAKQAISMIHDNIVTAATEHTPEALDNMMVASAMAGMAFGNSDVACVHSISEALGGLYDIPHGVANAMMLAPVSRFSVPGATSRYADIARTFGIDTSSMTEQEAAYMAVDRMQEMADKLDIPHFSQMSVVDPKDFPRLAKTAAHAEETVDNPREMSESDFITLLETQYNQK